MKTKEGEEWRKEKKFRCSLEGKKESDWEKRLKVRMKERKGKGYEDDGRD